MPSSKRSKLSKKNIKSQGRSSNGDFSKRILLCQECVIVLCQECAIPDHADVEYEILVEDDDISEVDDDEVWTAIEDDLGEDLAAELSNSNFDEDAIDERLAEVNLKWREAHLNSNVRGAGSSKSTFYRLAQVEQKLQINAKECSTPITRWFQPKESEDVSDDVFIVDAIENPAPKPTKQKKSSEEPKFTITTAMEYLIQHEAKISKNKQINKNMAKEINLWYYICSLSLYQYFAHLRFISCYIIFVVKLIFIFTS